MSYDDDKDVVYIVFEVNKETFKTSNSVPA